MRPACPTAEKFITNLFATEEDKARNEIVVLLGRLEFWGVDPDTPANWPAEEAIEERFRILAEARQVELRSLGAGICIGAMATGA